MISINKGKQTLNPIFFITGNNKLVGFTYRLYRPRISLVVNNTMYFFNRIADVGGEYNVSDGKFHCQHSGLYIFATTIITVTEYLPVYIMKNGVSVGYTYGYKSTSGNSFSTTVVINLNVGDEVWIKVGKIATIDGWSLFAGARISD